MMEKLIQIAQSVTPVLLYLSAHGVEEQNQEDVERVSQQIGKLTDGMKHAKAIR